jgi:hypothetical protein
MKSWDSAIRRPVMFGQCEGAVIRSVSCFWVSVLAWYSGDDTVVTRESAQALSSGHNHALDIITPA